MYAVIQTGGKQYRVAQGDVIRIEKLEASIGDSVTFDRVLLIGEGDSLRTGEALNDASVKAIVREQGRGQKVRIFKKRRRKNYRLTKGHRQSYTTVSIADISA